MTRVVQGHGQRGQLIVDLDDHSVTRPAKQQALSFYNFFFIHHLYSITVQSAAPQTALRGGPGPRIEPGMGSLEAGRDTNPCLTTPP